MKPFEKRIADAEAAIRRLEAALAKIEAESASEHAAARERWARYMRTYRAKKAAVANGD